MPERPVRIRKGFDILEEVEKIRNKATNPPKGEDPNYIQQQILDALRMQWHTDMPRYFASSVWRELLLKTRRFPKTEFRDNVSELRQEVDTLKFMVKSLAETIESSNKTIEELSNEIRHKQTDQQIRETPLNSLCNAYIEMVSNIEIINKIYISETIKGLSCWTIIDAEPFDSAICEPIYDAQVSIYKEIKADLNLSLDFHVLNLTEICDRQELDSILPSNAKLVWQRR